MCSLKRLAYPNIKQNHLFLYKSFIINHVVATPQDFCAPSEHKLKYVYSNWRHFCTSFENSFAHNIYKGLKLYLYI